MKFVITKIKFLSLQKDNENCMNIYTEDEALIGVVGSGLHQ